MKSIAMCKIGHWVAKITAKWNQFKIQLVRGISTSLCIVGKVSVKWCGIKVKLGQRYFSMDNNQI